MGARGGPGRRAPPTPRRAGRSRGHPPHLVSLPTNLSGTVSAGSARAGRPAATRAPGGPAAADIQPALSPARQWAGRQGSAGDG
ncbi:hypothetical protein I549_5165 [Mycobacterium avium subsp. avium 2285 (R)]|nr:hypothetical protein I549_5165 [Mycobacterium avium subsp. avium 2285 (R)]